ncbi:radical SAM protein [Candidatus Pacearchaeota archaeon]|nr:hypothetical protein [uncultured archaeon]MBS3078840.1 radical SAM protein [Candidatus Pacearchaeota archaeon]
MALAYTLNLLDNQRKKLREELLEEYISRGEEPFDYERQLFVERPGFLEKVLNQEVMPPWHFEVLPTERCNNNCIWCRGGHRDFMASEKDLSEEVMFRLMGELADYGVDGIIRFSGMSGEPLMNPGALPAIKEGIRRGLNVGLISNGILLDERAHDYLSGAVYVNTSLDASNSETFNELKGHRGDVFDMIVDNVRKLALFKNSGDYRFRVGVGYLVHPKNYNGIVEAAKLIGSTGADILQFKLPLGQSMFNGQDTKKIEELLLRAQEYSRGGFKVEVMQSETERRAELGGTMAKPNFPKCYSQFLNGVVGADGIVYPCVHYYYQKGISGAPFGSLYEQSLREIWEGEVRKRIMRRIVPREDCALCNRYDHRMNRFINFIDSNGVK